MKRRIYLAIVASVMLLVCSCGGQQEKAREAVRVKTMKIEPTSVAGAQSYPGTVEETVGTALSFPVAGTLRQMNVCEGQRVAKGELIAVLDETTLRSAHDASVAALEQAEDAFRRMKQLHDNGSLPEIQWVEIQSKLKQAQSAESMTRKNLADGKLYAPFSGVIAEKTAEAGQNVMPGMQVAKLVKVNTVKVSVAIPESEIGDIRIGQSVVVDVAALEGRTFEGKVTEKGVAANALSRTYNIKATVNNPSFELLPGMLCDVQLDGKATDAAFVLPATAIQMDEQNRHFVWIAKDGKALRRIVSTGELLPEGVVVTSGIALGDMVIVEGQQKVSEGTVVKN